MIYKGYIRFLVQKISIFLLLLLHTPGTLLQASEVERVMAIESYPQWYSEEDLILQGNVGIEAELHSHNWIQYYAKPSFAYATNDQWALHGGLGLYYTDYKKENNNFELRPFTGVSYFLPLTEKWKLSSYFRAEGRFQYDTETEEREETLRLRLRLRTIYEINPSSEKNSWRKMTFGVEGFKSNTNGQLESGIQDNYDYEVRISTGLERNLHKNQNIRFELSWKYQGKPNNIAQSSLNTFYFKIQYYPVWGGILGNTLFDRGIEE